MLSYEKLEKKYKKRIENLFKDFLDPEDECLNLSEEEYEGVYKTTRTFFKDDENFNEMLYKALKPYTYYDQNKFHISKKMLFQLIPVMYVEHYYEWYLDYILYSETIADSVVIKDWNDVSEDFQSAFERFYKIWDKCKNEKYKFEYAKELFQVIYEEYPELCTEAFPIVLFVFTDSYFDFCRICHGEQKDMPVEFTDEMKSDILSLFKDRISGEDFQYYLFSLIDIKPGYYSESSFEQAKILYDTLLKNLSKKIEKSVNNPKAIHVKYKDLLGKIGDKCNERLAHLKNKYRYLMVDAYYKSENPLRDLPVKRDVFMRSCFHECRQELANIIKEHINRQNSPTNETELFMDEAERLLSNIYDMANNSFLVSYKSRMAACQKTKELIEEVIFNKYNQSVKKINKNTKKQIETIQPCKNFEAVWRFMHDFSFENETDNYWANYDINFTLFVLNYATGWIDSMVISAKKDIPPMFYPCPINLRIPATSHHISSIISRFFNTIPNSYVDLDLATYNSLIDFYECILVLYAELQEDCLDIFNDDTFDKDMPDDIFDITDYYDEIWELLDLPSIEDLKSLLAQYIYWVYE